MAAPTRSIMAVARAAQRTTLAVTTALVAALLSAAAAAQDAAPAVQVGGAREGSRWDLPRIFYDPRQRRSLDAQDRSIRLGLTAGGAGAGGPRFDGWLSGPTGTHAWVSGTRYETDRAGRLRAAGEPSGPGVDAIVDGNAHLDRSGGVLVVHRETEGTLHLRVGEADNVLDPTAPVPAGPVAH